jgi:hypothetical protein
MGYGCSVRYGSIRPGAPVSTGRLCSDQPRMARGRGILRGSCGRCASPALLESQSIPGLHCSYSSRPTAPAQVSTRADRTPCAVLDDHPSTAACLRIRDLLCRSSVVLEYLEFSRLLSPSRHRIPGVCRQRLGGAGGAPVYQIIDLCFPSASSDQCDRRRPHTELGIDTFFAGAQCCRVAKDEWPVGRRPHRIAGCSSLDCRRVPRTNCVFLGMRVSRHVRRL